MQRPHASEHRGQPVPALCPVRRCSCKPLTWQLPARLIRPGAFQQRQRIGLLRRSAQRRAEGDQVDNAGVSVALTQLRNLLSGRLTTALTNPAPFQEWRHQLRYVRAVHDGSRDRPRFPSGCRITWPTRVISSPRFRPGRTRRQHDDQRSRRSRGSRHTLYTTTLGPGGKPIGRLPEQMPYLEQSAPAQRLPRQQDPQQCHMPAVCGAGRRCIPHGQAARRRPLSHLFVGANFLMEIK